MNNSIIFALITIMTTSSILSMEPHKKLEKTQEYICSICLEDKKSESLRKFYCNHTICTDCAIHLTVDESETELTICPNPYCRSTILDTISYIRSKIKIKECPHCDTPFTKEGCPNPRALITCICKYNFCWNCLKEWENGHATWYCSDNQFYQRYVGPRFYINNH